jgi:hypothetical protein
MGDFDINQIIFYFAEIFEKLFTSIVKNFKNLDCKNMELNLGLVQISTLVVNKLTTRIKGEL